MEFLARRQTSGDIECGLVEAGCVFGALLRSGEDQRHARLVDEDAVGLVHDRKMQAAQEEWLMAAGKSALEYPVDEEPRAGAAWTERKPVAKVIEDELFVGAVGDVTRVSALPFLGELAVLDQPDGKTERIVDGCELLGVAACEIVVDRDDMDGTAHEGGGDRRQQRRQGLAFAGFHFGKGAAHHGGAAEQLNVEVALPDVAACRLARKRERKRHFVRMGAGRQQSCTQLVGKLAQAPVRQVCELRFQVLDPQRKALEAVTRERRQQIGRDAAPRAEQGAIEPALLAGGPLRIGRICRQRTGVDDAGVGGARPTC